MPPNKRILIISADRTGYGHASIAQAISEQLALFDDVETDVIDGFSLIGDFAVGASGLYGSVARRAPKLWQWSYKSAGSHPGGMADALTALIRKRFLRLLRQRPPGLVLSVHPLFNGPVINNLAISGNTIPFIVMLADLVDIHPLWADRRADLILCPGSDSLYAALALGVPREKLRLCSFPVRAAFTQAARECEREPYDGKRPLRCLLMSGGDGAGNLADTAAVLLKHFDAHVTILCGHNERLRRTLKKSLSPFAGRFSALGFQKNAQDYMVKADVALMRAGPNSMMEAVVCATPLILTGSLPGQEARNPDFAQMRELGVSCPDARSLAPLLRGLLADNAAGLRHISEKQRAFRNLGAAGEIAGVLYERTAGGPPA